MKLTQFKPSDFNVEEVKKLLPQLDGHTIFSPEMFSGLPAKFVESMTQTFKSDTSDPKSTIFNESGIVKELTGVYGLDVLRRLASIFNVTYPSAFGRGTQARLIVDALQKHLG